MTLPFHFRVLPVTLLLCMSHTLHADTISLNGQWLFVADSIADYSLGIPAAKATTVNVPHTWNVTDQLADYIGRAWYERTLTIPAEMKGKQLRLHFAAVYHDAEVYINGQRVGEHRFAGYTPFSLDITKAVKYGQDNKLVVSVDNHRHLSI